MVVVVTTDWSSPQTLTSTHTHTHTRQIDVHYLIYWQNGGGGGSGYYLARCLALPH